MAITHAALRTGPEERLDILTGRLRIRELPLAANENANLQKYLVTDDNGVVHWRNIPNLGRVSRRGPCPTDPDPHVDLT